MLGKLQIFFLNDGLKIHNYGRKSDEAITEKMRELDLEIASYGKSIEVC